MRLSIITIIVVGNVSTAASAETLYLNCQQTYQPRYTFSDLYANPSGVTTEQYVEDLWNSDIGFFTSEPPTTWVVDTEKGTVETPEEGIRPYQIIENSKVNISATFNGPEGFFRTWTLNRINGQLKTFAFVPKSGQASWKKAHGKVFPSSWSWTYFCTKSVSPLM